jgi:hypothetical protein
LVVIDDGDGWGVRLDGVEVVSFTGPHARERAVCEREELAQLLDAQSHGASSDRHYRAHPFLAVTLAACRIAGDCTALLLGVLGATRDRRRRDAPARNSDFRDRVALKNPNQQ